MKWLALLFKLCLKLALVALFIVTKGAEMMLQAINSVLQKSFEK